MIPLNVINQEVVSCKLLLTKRTFEGLQLEMNCFDVPVELSNSLESLEAVGAFC
jgi:hypothetical protein